VQLQLTYDIQFEHSTQLQHKDDNGFIHSLGVQQNSLRLAFVGSLRKDAVVHEISNAVIERSVETGVE